ncbi:HEAT repeat domain-containing protein [Haliangium sp.]|uniref:HEAT repeat domain-containing protein n=1 Tax=Haliangium sp. TaxID=2663208 RepID=UPI003D11DCAB
MAEKYGPHVERLHAVAASPSRRLLAIGGERDVDQSTSSASSQAAVGSSLHLLTLPKLTAATSVAVDGAVHALAFAGDELIVAGLSTGAVLGWDASEAGTTTGAALPERLRIEDAHAGAVHAVAVAAGSHGLLLASVGDDGRLRLARVDAQGATLVAERVLSPRPLRAVAFSFDGTDPNAVAVAGDDGVIRALSVAEAGTAEPREMPCGEGGIGSLCFTGDGRIAAGCGDGSIRLCYLEGAVDAENRAGEAAHEGMVTGLVMSLALTDEAKRPLPARLFSIGADGALKAWLMDSRRRPRTVSLGTGLRALALVEPGRTNKPERRGGSLVAVDDQRRIHVRQVNEQAEPAESGDRLGSVFDRLDEELGASSTKVRQDALASLGALPEDDARILLDRALARDRRPEVRKQAAEVIGASGRRLSRPALREALSDSDKGVRRAALAALTTIDEHTPLAPVRAALAAPYADLRVSAVKRLPGLRETSPLVPGLIAERLGDDADEVRRAALDALYQISDDAIEPVRVALHRGPADVRADALVRLARARLAIDPAGASLVEDALDDDAPEVRRVAFLISLGARPALAKRVGTFDTETRRALAELERRGRFADTSPDPGAAVGEDDLAPLFSALTCRHADTSLAAARCLGLLGDPRATGALLQLSREDDAEVRRDVVAALARAAMAMPADTRLRDRLGWLLDDDDATVRTAAFDALAELAAPGGAGASLDLAARALTASREDVRLRALPILVEFGGRGRHANNTVLADRAGALLGRALDDEHHKIRAEAFSTLWAWHSSEPRTPLTLGAACRHADVRKRVVEELARIGDRAPGHWADDLLLGLLADSAAEVGLAALDVLTGKDEAKKKKSGAKAKAPARLDVFRAALDAPRPEVRAAGCKGAPREGAADLRDRLVELVGDEHAAVHLAAIAAIDRLVPDDAEGFARAFASDSYELRVRAAELCGRRRDTRAMAPAQALLGIPEGSIHRPSDRIRQRAARALADVGDPSGIPFLIELLDDTDPVVREMGARGLATSCRPGAEKPLADALSHADLAVRSWVAEGLARLGDERAVPVLAGTLSHDHQPIRLGAIMGFSALGPDGVSGLLMGLDDRNQEIQDLVLAVVVARDVALARAGEAPDLLLSALSAASPEIRFVAARLLEARVAGEDLGPLAQELVGPRKPDKAGDMKDWPDEAERRRRLDVLVAALAGDHPAQRYAATQVLSLRGQALGFWREAGRLLGPTAAGRPRIPYTTWEDDEAFQPRKKGWLRSLTGARLSPRPSGSGAAAPTSGTERVLTVLKFAGAPEGRRVPPAPGAAAGFTDADAFVLAYGTYAGLIRQAPVRGAADETHRVRRDSVSRLTSLAGADAVGRGPVLPVLRRALSDPHHLVRRAAMSALRGLYPDKALEPLGLALEATAADVGRAAVDELVAAALAGDEAAAALTRQAIDAPAAEVRSYAMTQLPRLFEAGSLEPWLIALGSRHADVRLSVVDRLLAAVESTAGAEMGEVMRTRVSVALGRAMESDHEDLRLKAAEALARRGDARTVDALAGMLRAEEGGIARRAREALVALAHARPLDPNAADTAAQAAAAIAARIDDDPDRTADRPALIEALGRIGSPAGGDVLLGLLGDDDAAIRRRALTALLGIARGRDAHGRVLPPRPVGGRDRARRQVYDEPLALTYLGRVAELPDASLRIEAARTLRDLDDRGADELLARLIEDRDESVRVAACEAMAFRAEYVDGAGTDTLASTLRAGRRELVLPAAVGLASRGRPEAFQALLLVFKAAEQADRERAVLALGTLGDRRALEELEPLLGLGDRANELAEEDAALAPMAAQALGCMLPRLRDDDPEHPGERTRVRDAVEYLAREGSPALRGPALTGLRHAAAGGEDERSRSLIERIAGDPADDTAIRVHAVEQLGELADPGSEAVLAELLSESEYRLRHAAMSALDKVFPRRDLGHRTRTSLLALRSPREDISAPAATFLARRGDPALLVDRLAEIDSDEIRRRLRQGLVRRGACPLAELERALTGEHLGALVDAAWIAGAAGEAAPERATKERLAAAVTAALTHAAQAWRTARAATSAAADSADAGAQRLDRAEQAWRACLWAAARLDADTRDGARAALTGAGVTAPASVRREALHFLGNHGDDADVELVGTMLSDPDASVRAAAAAAYARLAPSRAREALAGVAVADAAALAPIAAAALSGDGADGRELLTSDTSRRLVLPVVLGQKRAATLDAVARAGGQDPARLVAIAALGRLGGADAERALDAIFRDESEQAPVRAAAYRALRRLQRAAAKADRYREEEPS